MKIDIDHQDRALIVAGLQLLASEQIHKLRVWKALQRLLHNLQIKQPVPMPDDSDESVVMAGDIVLYENTRYEVVHYGTTKTVLIARVDADGKPIDPCENWPYVPLNELTFPQLGVAAPAHTRFWRRHSPPR